MEKKILVAIPTAEHARRADFFSHHLQMRVPGGSVHAFHHGPSPASNRNILIKMAQDNGCTHIFFMDDDMYPKPDLLERLMAHDVDIVSGLYLMRKFPHMAVAFDKSYSDGQCKYLFMRPEVKGLVEVVNCGFGCVLIDMKVFEKLEKPYVRLGEIFKDEWCDDIGFFNRVVEQGFKVYIDTDALVGHSLTVTLAPIRAESGEWLINYESLGGNVTIPQIIPSEEEVAKQEAELVGKTHY